jgi:hypothetical protein
VIIIIIIIIVEVHPFLGATFRLTHTYLYWSTISFSYLIRPVSKDTGVPSSTVKPAGVSNLPFTFISLSLLPRNHTVRQLQRALMNAVYENNHRTLLPERFKPSYGKDAITVYRNTQYIHCSAMIFNLFRSRTPIYIFSSTLYPQSCWCIIQVTHNLHLK